MRKQAIAWLLLSLHLIADMLALITFRDVWRTKHYLNSARSRLGPRVKVRLSNGGQIKIPLG